MQDNATKDALPRLAEGIRKACDIVAPTMGAAGTNVILQAKLPPYAITTNDGATIIKAIELADPIEKIGLGFLKEAVERSNANSGDGSTTTSFLLNAILPDGIKSGATGLELKNSLDECLPIIEKSLDEQTRPVSIEDIPAVAEIASENKALAQVLGEIYKEIGKDGIVHLEGSGTYETVFNIIHGIRLSGTGYLSPYMASDEEAKKAGRKETRAIYQNPCILVTKNKISRVEDIDPLIGALIAKGEKTLVIFADDMDSNVARMLIELQKNEQRSINILIIKAPVLWKNYVFEDFAKITDSTVIEDAAGTSLGKKIQLDWLGTCGTLIVDKDETTVIGIEDITDHLKAIKDDENLPSQDKAVRLAYLSTKTAILKLGAKSETELSYLRLKMEDAIHSSRLALSGGIVAGGGVALLNASYDMPDSVGGNILMRALKTPMLQIMKNAGLDEDNEWFPNAGGVYGFDVKSKQNEDMFDVGIIDAALIVKGAIRNALGIASTILTSSSVVALPPEDRTLAANPFPFQ